MRYGLAALLAPLVVSCLLQGCSASTPSNKISGFYESFDNASDFSKWKTAGKDKTHKYIKSINYLGQWETSPSTVPSKKAKETDATLKLLTPKNLHSLVRTLDKPIVITGNNTLVVQYEVKFPTDLMCGGGYLKLLTTDGADGVTLDNIQDKFDENSTQLVIFGPDRCRSNFRCHYSMSTVKPNKEDRELHSHEEGVVITERRDQFNLFTLLVLPNGKFKIKVNGAEIVYEDYANFSPPVYPPKKIVDPTAEDPNRGYKSFVVDTQAKKPDDWDDTQPEYIPDPNAKKPSDWDEDIEPLVKIDESVEEEYKKYHDPLLLGDIPSLLVMNPNCKNTKCGKWQPPTIPNPAYRGEWTPPLIPNPVPPVKWDPPMIDNPDYVEITNPNALGTVHAVAFDLWSTDGGIEFDNLYVGTSEEEADIIANETFFSKADSAPLHPGVLSGAKGLLSDVLQTLVTSFDDLKYIIKKYISDPYSIIKDTQDLRSAVPVISILSTSLAALILLVYLFCYTAKKTLCICKVPSPSKKSTGQKPGSKDKEHSDAKSDDEDSEAEGDDASSSAKETKGTRKRNVDQSSSKGKSAK